MARAEVVDKGGEDFGVVQGFAGLVPLLDAVKGQDHGNRGAWRRQGASPMARARARRSSGPVVMEAIRRLWAW